MSDQRATHEVVMSGFSFIQVHQRGTPLDSRVETVLATWSAADSGPLRGVLRSSDDGVLIELMEGRQSYWYSLSRDPGREKVARVVALLERLRCLEAVQSLHFGVALDGENELTASRSRMTLDEPARLFDLDVRQWKQNGCVQFPKSHCYRFEGVGVELGHPIATPDGQEAIGFFTDYWVVAQSPDQAWGTLSEHFSAEGLTCTETAGAQQVDFPADYEGETLWYGGRAFYSRS